MLFPEAGVIGVAEMAVAEIQKLETWFLLLKLSNRADTTIER